MYLIPDKINAFNVYQDGAKHIGISDEVTLPTLTEVVSTMAGPGLLGSIDSPTHGQFESIEFSLPFRTLHTNTFRLMSSLKSVSLTMRGSTQCMDGEGNLENVGMRVVVRGRKKEFEGGKLKQGEGTASVVKLELTYIMIEIDGVKELEVDKLNSIYKLHGVDQLAAIRALC